MSMPAPTSQPTIDYTNKDFASLRQALLDLARYRLPEWTDRSPADLGMLLIDLFAYMGDVVLYYQDRIAGESFLHTARERRSVLHLLRLIGYELAPAVAATAELRLTFAPPPEGASRVVTVPHGAQFATKGGSAPLTFEYLGPDLTIHLDSDQVSRGAKDVRIYGGLPVRHSRAVPTEVLGSSTGEPNQRFTLSQRPLILDTLLLEVDEGAGFVPWDRQASLLYNTAADGSVTISDAGARDYAVQFDEDGAAWVIFGDGVYGRRPEARPNNVRATYHVGGGAEGNVPAGAISEARTRIPLLQAVTNPQPAAGGADPETIEHAVRFGPLSFRSGQRAVTLNDYVALAHQAGGVAKVRAVLASWNQVDLYVAPQGDALSGVPEDLRRRLIAYFEDKRMAGTFVNVRSATPVPVDIALDVVPRRNHRQEIVRQAAEATARELLSFRSVDFGQPLYLSDLYAAIEAVPGVHAVTVRRFRRRDSQQVLLSELGRYLPKGQIEKIDQPGLAELLQRTLQIEVPPEGRIDIGDFEIPVLGQIAVTVKESPR